MPGLLSSVFDDGSSEQNQFSGDYAAQADGGLDLSPTVAVSHDAEASWEDPNGTAHTYQSDTDVVFTADVDATVTAAGSLATSSLEEG